MGMLRIEVAGSFDKVPPRTFSAQNHGHAHAVAEAIEFLSAEVLPAAIANDHRCHDDGTKPDEGFVRTSNRDSENAALRNTVEFMRDRVRAAIEPR